MTTYVDKFLDRASRLGIELAARKYRRKLDVVHFCEGVAEPVVSALLKEYGIDRLAFFGAPIVEYGLELLLAGVTTDRELRGYFVHQEGISEPLEQYGTIGSGAAYAELFLRYLLSEPQIEMKHAARLAVYAIKGVELMDPHVGGDTNVAIITATKEGKLSINILPNDKLPAKALNTMEDVLGRVAGLVEEEVAKGERSHGDNAG